MLRVWEHKLEDLGMGSDWRVAIHTFESESAQHPVLSNVPRDLDGDTRLFLLQRPSHSSQPERGQQPLQRPECPEVSEKRAWRPAVLDSALPVKLPSKDLCIAEHLYELRRRGASQSRTRMTRHSQRNRGTKEG